jgi:hypothetical protein
MKRSIDANTIPYCPSAQPDIVGSVVFGVVGGTAQEPQLVHIELRPATNEVLALTQPVHPTEVFRFAAPCARNACQHFDGSNCRLVTRIVASLPTVIDRLPSCYLRPTCRWWQQEGKAACLRCPQIVTETHNPTEHLQQVASVTL